MSVDLMRPSSARIHAPTTAANNSCVLTLFVVRTPPSSSSCPSPSHPASRSIDWVQDTAAATTKWGDIGDWDVSGVADFSYAFSHDRDETGGSYSDGGNPKAATYVGSDLSKWKTTALTSLAHTFNEAAAMNSDLSGWNVAKVATLDSTFRGASKFAGTGLASWAGWDTISVTSLSYTFYKASEMNADLAGWKVGKVVTLRRVFDGASKFAGMGLSSWNVAKVTDMANTFNSATSISACSKRQIADSWAVQNLAQFESAVNTGYQTQWAADACPPLNDATFKQASWGT